MGWVRSKLRRWNSIHNQMLFFILVFLIIPLFFSTYYWIGKPLEQVIEHKIGRSTNDAMHQVNISIELFLHDMLRSAVDISTNPNIVLLLRQPEALTEYEKLRLTDLAINKPYSSYFSETYVTLLDMHGNWRSNKYVGQELYDEYIRSDWYAAIVKEPYGIRWMANNKEPFLYYDKEPLVTLVKTVTDPQTNAIAGTLLYSVKETEIRNYLGKLEGDYVVLDRSGAIVSGLVQEDGAGILSPESGIFAGIYESDKGQFNIQNGRDKWMINYDTINPTDWKLVQVIPYDRLFKEIFDLRRTNMIAGAIIVIVFMMFAFTISNRISKPIKLLNKRMKDIEKNDFNSSLSLSGPLEIATLIHTYNHMARKIRELLQSLKEEYQQKEEMRFRALQAQINPHFILNTLNNIKWMAYIRNDKEVGEMLSSLGSMMEASIGRGETIISLKEEIQYVQHYITLMKLRYNERLTVHYEIAEPFQNQEAIKFMLQPIIENSIIHGIERLERDGVIWIEASAEQDRFVLRVTDNGAGIPPERLQTMNKELQTGRSNSRSIGIMNVHERIRLQYGEPYGLYYESVQGEWTTAVITIPLKTLGERTSYAVEGAARR